MELLILMTELHSSFWKQEVVQWERERDSLWKKYIEQENEKQLAITSDWIVAGHFGTNTTNIAESV